MRLNEPPMNRLSELIPELAESVRSLLDRPFAFYGHSMGALVAFELGRALRCANGPDPTFVCVAGRAAPHLTQTRSAAHKLPDEEFVAYLRSLDGTPEQILTNPEALELLLPAIRADFELVNTYRFAPGPVLGCPLYVFGGRQDPGIAPGELRAWKDVTTGTCQLDMFGGGHFFVLNSLEPMLARIRSAMEEHSAT
jgi:medium-chain acyl-[acyl-carrier-protein] hydrolase